MAKKVILASEYFRVERIFENKGWPISAVEGEVSQYNHYLKRVSILPEDAKDLFFELTERFENITLNDILNNFQNSYNKINQEDLKSCRKIYFLPLVTPIIKVTKSFRSGLLGQLLVFLGINKVREIERPEQKSADKIFALIQIEYRNLFGSGKFVFPKSYLKFREQYNEGKDILILVDDFVGTGDTASEVLNFFTKKEKLKNKNIMIITLVSQNEGLNRIYNEYQINIYSNIIQDKALSDYYNDETTLANNQNLVIKMSEALSVKEDFFGYKKSEALVCILNKSPNNTLPIFWSESKSNPAPFPRYKIFKGK